MVPSGVMCVQRNMHAHTLHAVVQQFQIMDMKWNDRILGTLARIPKTVPTFDC